jgi:hypothetical protein
MYKNLDWSSSLSGIKPGTFDVLTSAIAFFLHLFLPLFEDRTNNRGLTIPTSIS